MNHREATMMEVYRGEIVFLTAAIMRSCEILFQEIQPGTLQVDNILAYAATSIPNDAAKIAKTMKNVKSLQDNESAAQYDFRRKRVNHFSLIAEKFRHFGNFLNIC